MTRVEKKALERTKNGFTYAADSIFRSFAEGEKVCEGLVKKGLAERVPPEPGYAPTYVLTAEGRDALQDLAPRKRET